MMKSLFEQNGGTYSAVGDYRLPDLTTPDEPGTQLGIWGLRRLEHLKKHRKSQYTNLLTTGELDTHLHEIDIIANKRCEMLIAQMAEAQGVTEQLKAENQMEWVGRMNNIRACADEIVYNELIYQ